MNGRTAKKIRKKVYGSNFSPKQRDYEAKIMKTKTIRDNFGVRSIDCVTVKATGLRRVYKDAKRDYYK